MWRKLPHSSCYFFTECACKAAKQFTTKLEGILTSHERTWRSNQKVTVKSPPWLNRNKFLTFLLQHPINLKICFYMCKQASTWKIINRIYSFFLLQINKCKIYDSQPKSRCLSNTNQHSLICSRFIKLYASAYLRTSFYLLSTRFEFKTT